MKLPFIITTIVAATAALSSLPAYSAVVASSDWDDGTTQGWVLGDDSRGTYELVSAGGNPGGYVRFIDKDSGAVGNARMTAPSSFLGNYSLLGQASFEWDAKSEVLTDGVGVVIRMFGANGELAEFRDPTAVVTSEWQGFTAPIEESSWILLSGTWDGLISNVTTLDLSLDIVPVLGQDGAVDNFTLTAVPVPPAVWLFGSGLLGLVGMARRKREQRNH
jgi:hypothetical protein